MTSPAGLPLADVLKRRGVLTPGELVTLLVPLARELADLHRGGIAHGAISPATVVIAADGRPTLTDGGVAGATPEDDHRALVALAGAALGRGATGPVADALRSGAVGDELATALLAACLPVPISVANAVAREPAHRTGSSTVHRGRTALVGMLTIALVAVVGVATAGHASSRTRSSRAVQPAVATVTPSSTAEPTVRPSPPQWAHVVLALEQRRASAYAHDDAALLSSIYVRPSRIRRADLRRVHQLLGDNSTVRGLSPHVLRVRLVRVTSRSAILVVVDTWSSYVVGRAGHVVRHGASLPAQRMVMVLRRTGDGWLIASVRR